MKELLRRRMHHTTTKWQRNELWLQEKKNTANAYYKYSGV